MADTTLLIEQSPGETRSALLSDGAVLQVDHYRIHELPLDGAVFHGRVRRIEPGLSAAFVDLDGIREGFLRARAIADRPKGAAIANLLREGEALFVRVVGEAPGDGDKLPRIATLSVADAQAVLAGRSAPSAPACVDTGPAPVTRILAEHGADATRIVCNAGPVKQAVAKWLAGQGLEAGVEQHPGDLFAAFGVEAAIEASLESKVTVPGGATLIFEPGETLCAVDVNSAGLAGASGRTARDVNLAVVPEIARQLRLREIAGAIVIDFLKMDRDGDREAVLVALRAALTGDPAQCHVLGLSRLGLMEITRERRKKTLAARLLRPAAVRSARADAIACGMLRQLAAHARRGGGQLSVSAAPDIVDLLNGAMAEALAESLSWSHAGVTLLSDSRRPIENFDISEVGIGGLR